MGRVLVLAAWLLACAVPHHGACAAATGPVSAIAGSQKIACKLLSLTHPDHTFFEGSDNYKYETQTQYWSSTAYNTPACVFVPLNAQQLSFAVTTLTLTSTKFAVRSGGHMPVQGYNSIGSSGVLLSNSNLSTLALSHDHATVSVGPAYRWRDVYSYLQPYNLTAVGGRVGHVGVAGLLLGGGISFHSSQYGFAADNVVAYEAVLSSGLIVVAKADNAYSDLYWALKGGGNSFAIVTRFDLRTVPSPGVWIGIAQYNETDKDKYLDAVYNFGKYGSADSKAAIIPTIVGYPSVGMIAYAASRFYDSLTNSPTVFENFTSLKTVADQYAFGALATYISAVDALQPNGLRQDFRVASFMVNREGLSTVHDTFFGDANSQLADIAGLTASITFQPVTKGFIENGRSRGGSNPQGVDANNAPYFWIVQNLSWQNAGDDDTVRAFAKATIAKIEGTITSHGIAGGYLYMNDAGDGQPVFQSYPSANLRRLKDIRTKYDPFRIYTNLLVGGWKVLDA
ncbi:uncharacterized protein TrAFT101_010774 [Trichoderma asperellum]|uniref:FAD-binding PCMH-type domain-containing protein n=1 Tax=Trichoderma asperellum (strain ATCC 204424 / CBS 433.97 / NBRC 101777) TaxID=1042311 RepID=A0A2T3YQB7_TRIA4|nr:hypothetical protein M441DRAFT_32551 [Trichoderma asperellum CBS 433.97]PTB34724.1 hypothetical protein M441DRAFT_32551 [Trichoderma asperellum CBS 433.97]UKZ95968.1 hypothetical protein TrAFT101_010774 [Trichoderma asperellum]